MKLAKKLQKKLKAIWNWIVLPPHDGVPWIVWLYVAFACSVYRHGGVFAGHLSGFDDHVRMTEILNWINGAGWYDRTIMRANMPEGFTTIWVRLVDIPTAAVIVLAQFFTDQRTAALIASVIVPFAELGLLFPVARYFARPVVGKDKAWLIVLFLMFTTVLNFKRFSISGFQTGEASHHSWYIILDLALFGAAGRIALGTLGRSAALVMGGSTALLIAVGIEGYPMIVASIVILTALAWYYNRPKIAQRACEAMTFGAVLNLLLLPMHQPPSTFFDVTFTGPSILGPILISTAALYLAFEYFILKKMRKQKFVSLFCLFVAAMFFATALVIMFPQMKDGPGAGLSPAERHLAVTEHYEGLPVHKVATSTIDCIGLMMPTALALIAALFAIRISRNKRRRSMLLAYLGVTAFAGIMPEIYSRYIHHALTTSCVFLLWAWEKIKSKLPKNRNYNLAALAVFVALGPFWMLLLPAFDNDVPILSQVLLYPAKIQTVQDPCDVLPIAFYINQNYSKDKTLIIPNWDSSRFLYYTDVKISFVANYPSHDKFIDNENFFATPDMEQAKAIAAAHDIDLVAACRTPLMIEPRKPLESQTLLGRLQVGRPPPWLKYVGTVPMGSYVLYEVDKAALAH